MALQLQCFDSSTDAALVLAGEVAADLGQTLKQQKRALLLVSGGRSPLPLFSALAQQPLAWHDIAISLVDERCVPITHDDSNSALVRRHLISGAAACAPWIALVPDDVSASDTDRWDAATQAANVANQNIALATPSVVVLGIGTDGHTASLFADAPQWSQARTTDQRYLAVQPGRAPHPRVSLSLSALVAQGCCRIWAVGIDKLATIERCRQLPADACALSALIAEPRVLLQVFYSPS